MNGPNNSQEWIIKYVNINEPRTKQCASFNDLQFSLSLLSKLLANFMILSLFLWISQICCLLMPYSVDKLVLFVLFLMAK